MVLDLWAVVGSSPLPRIIQNVCKNVGHDVTIDHELGSYGDWFFFSVGYSLNMSTKQWTSHFQRPRIKQRSSFILLGQMLTRSILDELTGLKENETKWLSVIIRYLPLYQVKIVRWADPKCLRILNLSGSNVHRSFIK